MKHNQTINPSRKNSNLFLKRMRSILKSSFLKNQILLFIGIFFFIQAVSIHKNSTRPEIIISKQDSAFNLDITFLKLFSSGNQKLISNILWIQTLMESDLEKYAKNKYADWMYLRFLAIANLDPWFYQNYLYGGMYLSVVKDDLEGAAQIFNLGLEKYPDDYKLNYYQGFNYFFEMGDYEKGYQILKKLKTNPKTPFSLKFVINKLQFETSGNYDFAINYLKGAYNLTSDERVKKKIINDIYALSAERDLKCLNDQNSSCNKLDTFGLPYVKDSKGNWKAQKEYLPFKIFRPKR